MPLHKSLTTVTSFSKYLAMVLFVTLPFVGFYLGAWYQKTITVSPPSLPIRREKFTRPVIPPSIPLASSIPITGHDNQWLQYKNTVHSYSVDYPAGWQIASQDANNVEDFQSSTCCHVARLTFTHDDTVWEFLINPLISGFLAPDACQEGPDTCYTTSVPMRVLGYQVNRVLISVTKTKKVVAGYMSVGNRPAFGTIGITTKYATADQPKYILRYSGNHIEDNLAILDAISQSLQPMKN